MENDRNGKNEPSYTAYHVRDGKTRESKSFWTKIGSAWAHEDGEGFNLRLEMMPFDGKIVLRSLKTSKRIETEDVSTSVPSLPAIDDEYIKSIIKKIEEESVKSLQSSPILGDSKNNLPF